jgi:hypothetical protein
MITESAKTHPSNPETEQLSKLKEKHIIPSKGIATKLKLVKIQTAISNRIFMKRPRNTCETSSLNNNDTKKPPLGKLGGLAILQTDIFTTDREANSMGHANDLNIRHTIAGGSHIFSAGNTPQRPSDRKLSFSSKTSSMILQKRSGSPKVLQPVGDQEPNVPKIEFPKKDGKPSTSLNGFMMKIKPKYFNKLETRPDPKEHPDISFLISNKDNHRERDSSISMRSSCALNFSFVRQPRQNQIMKPDFEEPLDTTDRGKRSSDIEGLSSHHIILEHGLLKPPKSIPLVYQRKSASVILKAPRLSLDMSSLDVDDKNKADRYSKVQPKIKFVPIAALNNRKPLLTVFRSSKWIDPGHRCEEEILQEWRSIL